MKLTCVVTSGCRWASAAACLLLSSAHADTPALSALSASSTPSPSFEGTKGWGFGRMGYPSLAPIYITQLGVFDQDGDGLVNAHQVGLWKADGILLASGTVPAGMASTLQDGYRFVPITPVIMPIGFGYNFIVAAQYSAGDLDDQIPPVGGLRAPILLNPPAGKYGLGAGLPFPGYQTPMPEGGSGTVYWQANFQFAYNIPEPVPWRLLAPALFLVFRRARSTPCD